MNSSVSKIGLLALLIVPVLLCPVHVGHAADAMTSARSKFEIPVVALADALSQFGEQSGLQLVYAPDLVSGLKSRAVSGRLTAEAALAALLKGTGLSWERVNDTTIALRKVKAEPPAASSRLPAASGENLQQDGYGADVDQVLIEGQRPKPYTDANADIPRTIDDAQPYYVFTAETISQSGAVNVEDFLKQRLTMNATAQTNGQTPSSQLGNTSSINLRGLGADKTLILVNGRRMAGVNITFTGEFQPDLNGIPLSSIDRIEVLPSSASGIYGGSAIGGVVNVILKRDYTGGEARVTYDNTWSADSPRRNAYLSYGLGLEGGKTHLTFNTSWSDEEPLLLRDRVQIYEDHLSSIQGNYPTFVYDNSGIWPGNLPNIASNDFSASTLTLKNGGVPLNSLNTFVPAGTSSTTSGSALDAGLLGNAGHWNMDFPESAQSPTGLLREFGSPARTRAFQMGARRQMLPRWEVFADFAYTDNRTRSNGNPVNSILFVGADVPTNPFTTAVKVQVPDAGRIPVTTSSESLGATLGTVVQLPWDWTGALDYTWSENRFDYQYFFYDNDAQSRDLLSGELNPFVDTLLHPVNLQKYVVPITFRGSNRLQDINLRGSGPLPALPWGIPRLTVGLEHRLAQTPERTERHEYPLSMANDTLRKYYDRESTTDSGYLEATVPLLKSGWLPGLHALELQLSGRSERFEVDTGTPYEFTFYNVPGAPTYYSPPTLDGASYFSQASYTSDNYTLGLKYQPVKEVTLRVSQATAFLPPGPMQLLKDAAPSPFQSYLIDPTLDPGAPPSGCIPSGDAVFCPVYTLSGGNPDLKPQDSRSLNAGIIWEPSWQALSGLRLDAEYYRIQQFNAIGNLDAQVIVDQEASYPDRVIRDDTGRITQVDVSSLNLYRRDTEGWDLSASYALRTPVGQFSLYAVESIIMHLENQYSQTQPEYDAVNFPSEGGAAKYKTNASLSWERGPMMAGWTARYFSSYSQYGAPGGPLATQQASSPRPSGPSIYVIAQGSETIPSQIYHDLFLGYTFDRAPVKGLALQLSVRNVFDKVAPLDVFYDSNYYMSPYGDVRLRSYWLSARLGF